MSQNEETIQAFMNLGLTNLQAKIFITLFRLGGAGQGVRKISRESNIARQDIYRLLPSLQKMGLVQKIISTPTKYKAISLESGFSMLLQQKTEEYQELQKKATMLFNNFKLDNPKVETQEEMPQFTITSGRNLLFKNMEKTVLQAQTNIDVISAIEGIKLMLFYALPYLKKAIGRGVQIRIITDKAGKELIEKNLSDLKKLDSPAFQYRWFSGQIPVGMALFDNKEASICVTSDQIVPSLWTTNPNVLTLAQTYFEGIWAKSKQIETTGPAESQAVELSAE